MDSFFPTNYVEKIDHPYTKKINQDDEFMPYTKINSKCTVHLNTKWKKLKLLKENLRENLFDLGFGDEILDTMNNIILAKWIW